MQDEVPAHLKRLKLTKRQNPHAVLNATLPVVLVEAVEGAPAIEGKKERPAKEKIVTAGKAVVSSIGMRLVPIRKGTFQMGSPVGEENRSDHDQNHQHQRNRCAAFESF